MTKEEAIDVLEDIKVKIAIPRLAKTQLDKNEALEIAIKNLKTNDRNEMIMEDIKRIIKRYDEMNVNVSFEERKENHIKAYMEIKGYFNNCTIEDEKNEICSQRE